MPNPRAVLVGPPGCGKSTIGRRLAHALNLPHLDTDDLIAQRFRKPCGAVLQSLGEPEFRKIEAEEVAKALDSEGIVSLGGGAVLTDSTRELLQQHTTVYIKIGVSEGLLRTKNDRSRPLLVGGDPAEKYRTLLTKREPLYAEVASIIVHGDGRHSRDVASEVLRHLDDLA